MKQCSKCKKLLDVNSDNFHRDKHQKDGFTTTCKICRLQAKKNYDSNNREIIRSKATKRYYDHIEKFRQQSLDYYYNNLESCKQRNIIWIAGHPEERKEHKRRSNLKRKAILRGNTAEHITKVEILELLNQYPNCPYCGITLTRKNTQLDHVYPISKGGQHTIFNLIPCCKVCNNQKQNKLPIQWFLKMKI